ncbi:hypothetical protein FJZ48_00985 [Candidatus Uhrbacteria bacterium]|nr:hypothetical protein [Candidatus Uhrbacteria bacterium]
MKLDAKALGLTSGIFCGGGWVLLMLLSLWMEGAKSWTMLMGPMHPGFSYGVGGAIWMAVLHFIIGGVLGWLFAMVYNTLAKK